MPDIVEGGIAGILQKFPRFIVNQNHKFNEGIFNPKGFNGENYKFSLSPEDGASVNDFRLESFNLPSFNDKRDFKYHPHFNSIDTSTGSVNLLPIEFSNKPDTYKFPRNIEPIDLLNQFNRYDTPEEPTLFQTIPFKQQDKNTKPLTDALKENKQVLQDNSKSLQFTSGVFQDTGKGLGQVIGSLIGDIGLAAGQHVIPKLLTRLFGGGYAEGGMIGEINSVANRERAITGRRPYLIIASEGERILTQREAKIWNQLQRNGVAPFADGGMVGTVSVNNSNMKSNQTTINVPVNVNVGSDSSGDIDVSRLSDALQRMVSDGIRNEMRPGGSIRKGNPYGR